MDLKSNSDYLFIDSKEKVVYSIPASEIEELEFQVDKMYKVSNTYIPHLPVGINEVVYNSLYIGEISIKDYKAGNRYIIVEDTPASRILYGNPVNKYTT